MHLSTKMEEAREQLKLELRFMKVHHRSEISQILSASDFLWKSFMGSIPRSRNDPSPKYCMDSINIIESAYRRLGKNPVEIIFDEWGTTGRKRPTLEDLIYILKESPQFNQALHYITTSILGIENSQDIPISECIPTVSASEIFSSEENKGPNNVDINEADLAAKRLWETSWTSNSSSSKVHPSETVCTNLSEEESIGVIDLQAEIPAGPGSLAVDLPRLNYNYLENITQNFSEVSFADGGSKLGKGSFGSVYYGVMHGQLGLHGPVAVKKLDRGRAKTDTQFNTEIECMRFVHHQHLLSLLAYSNDGVDLCLVYEYMENGNLADKLRLRNGSTVPLTASQRLKISVETSEGLSYLHNHSHEKALVHRDIKPENILLDRNLSAKISDFGLVRLTGAGDFGLSVDQTSMMMGTPLYMAPEAMRGEVSDKMDVYSFGVVLLEIITSIPAIGDSRTSNQSLVSYIEDLDDLCSVVDSVFTTDLAGTYVSYKMLYNIAEQCLCLNRRKRPSIEEVKEQLKSLQ